MTDLLAILALLGGLQGAQAQPVPRIHYDGPPAIHRPQPRTGSVPLPAFNVTYHGGPVQNGPNSYAIYWFPSRGSTFNAYVAGIDRYLSDAGRAPLYDVPASYSTAANPIGATKFAQAYVDGHPFPGTLNEVAVESELELDAAALHLSPTTHMQFFLYLPAGAPLVSASAPPVCGMHGYTNFHGSAASPLVFAIVPFATAPACETSAASVGGKTLNPTPGVDNAIANTSREQAEMITDPLGNGWYDDTYGEIGQLCYYDYGNLGGWGNNANLEVDSGTVKDYYVVPEEWSQRAAACAPNLPAGQSATAVPTPVYNGGAVQPSTQTFAIYWGPASAFSTSFILDTEQFLRDVGGSQWYQVLTEYTGSYNGSKQTVANTSTFLGGYADTKNVAPARVTVADIAAEIASVIAHEPPSWKPGITTQFHIFLPPGSAYGAGDCGYHDSTTLAGSPVVFEVYQYPSTNLDTGCGNDPWQLPAADGNSQASRVIATMAHEMAESVTDPIFVSGHGTGWHGSIPESEVADVCGGDVGRFATTIPGANIVINGHGYRLPAIWSITAKACKPNF